MHADGESKMVLSAGEWGSR